MRLFFFCTIILVSTTLASTAQSLSLFDVDASAFPVMKGKLYGVDGDGQQLRPTASEVSLAENGIPRTVLSVTCPQSQFGAPVSLVMSIDVSASMKYGRGNEPPIDVGRELVGRLTPIINHPSSELALQKAGETAHIVVDFTHDRGRILSALSSLQVLDGDNFPNQLLNPTTGLLSIASRGIHKRVAVVYTDDAGQPLSTEELQACLEICATYDIEFYAITYPRINADSTGIRASLKTLATATGGMLITGVESLQAAEEVARQLGQQIQGDVACEITWQSQYPCRDEQRDITVETNGLHAQQHYALPGSKIARLQFFPSTVVFDSKHAGRTYDTTVMVTAVNAPFVVSNLTSTSPFYSVLPRAFSLARGESLALTVRYTPADSSYAWTRFDLQTNLCTQIFQARGGHTDVRLVDSSLRLVHPNGHEVLVAGGDTVIHWSGIPASDSVRLEFSLDDGRNWSEVTQSGTGGSHHWNIPVQSSTTCLMRASTPDPRPSQLTSLLLVGHTDEPRYIVWSPDGTRLASAGFDSTARIWDTHNGQLLHTLKAHSSWLDNVAWSPDGNRLATVGNESVVGLWDAATGTLIETMTGHTYRTHTVAWNPSGNRLVTAGNDAVVRLWDGTTGTPAGSLTGHWATVLNVAWRRDGRMLATASLDRTIGLWDAATTTRIDSINTWSRGVNSVTWSPEAGRLAMTHPDYSASIWDATTGGLLHSLYGHGNPINDLAWSPDGSMLATAAEDRTVRIWDATTGGLLAMFSGHAVRTVALAWSPDGRRLATSGRDLTGSSARIWEAATGKQLWVLTEEAKWVTSVAWSPDGRRLAMAVDNNTIRIWEIPQGKQTDSSDALFTIVMPLAESHDIDMGEAVSGTTKDSVITTFIRNIGSHPFAVRDIYIDGEDASQFALVSGMPPFSVAAGDARHVELRFQPSSPGMKTARITIITQADTLVRTIQGEGIDPATLAAAAISVSETAAHVGEFIDVAILLDQSSYLQYSTATSITAELRFNATMLVPIGSTPDGTIIGRERIIPIEMPLPPDSNKVLTRLRFGVLLGNDSTTTLRLDAPAAVGGTVAIRARSGTFHLLGICEIGGPRLIIPNGVVGILKITPNPATGTATLEIETRTAGHTHVTVTDLRGRIITTLFDGELQPGRHALPINTDDLPTGSYYVTLSTPTVRRIHRMDVIQ